MKSSNRKFATRDKVIIGFLILILLAFSYYYFFHLPVKAAKETAVSEKNATQLELKAVNNKIAEYQRMDNEISIAEVSREGLYPMKRMEDSLNQTRAISLQIAKALSVLGNNHSFSASIARVDPAKGGFVSRVNVHLTFTASDEQTAADAIARITEDWEYRCLIGDLTFKPYSQGVSVSATVTFYQTTYDQK